MPVNRKLKIFLNYFLGPVVLFWVAFSIYTRISRQQDLPLYKQEMLHALSGQRYWYLVGVLVLMVVNWGIEARKWQLLVNQLEPISFLRAYYSVLSGVSISINTPNRIGEYGGRILHLRPENRLKAISLNMITSVSQLILTLVMGVLGIVVLVTSFPKGILAGHGLTAFWTAALLYGGITFSVITIVLYFKVSWLMRILEAVPGLKVLKPYLKVLDHYEWPLLLEMLILSFFRFVVFISQYLLLYKLLYVEVGWWQGFWVMSVVMLILAIIPTFAIAEVAIRIEVSKTLMQLYSPNEIGVDLTSFIIWIVNLIIPALIGSVLIFRLKIIRDQ